MIIIVLLFSNLAIAQTVNSSSQPLYSENNPNIAITKKIEESCYKYTRSNTSDGYCQCLAMRIYTSTVISEKTKTKLISHFSEIVNDTGFLFLKEGKEFKEDADACLLQTRNWVTVK